MPLSKKRATRVKDPEMQKAIDRIYDDINSLISAINQGVGDGEALSSGKAGDIRVVDTSDRDVSLEVRSKKGWYTLDSIVNTVLSESSISKDLVNCSDSLDGASLTGNALTTSEDVTVDELETCVGVLGGKINSIHTKLNTMIDTINNTVTSVESINSKAFTMIESRKGN